MTDNLLTPSAKASEAIRVLKEQGLDEIIRVLTARRRKPTLDLPDAHVPPSERLSPSLTCKISPRLNLPDYGRSNSPIHSWHHDRRALNEPLKFHWKTGTEAKFSA